MAFKDIVGNQRVKNILRKALNRGRVPGSLMFSGPEGVGKRAAALVVAKALNCLNKKDDSCEKCVNCLAVNEKKFPDVLEIKPQNSVIRIEQMREVKQIAAMKPMTGKKKIFIVNPIESLTVEAANSVLKVLEEPPEFSHIILLTENPYQVLPTIKSRCQKLTFTPVSRLDIQRALAEKGIEEKRARILSLAARGNLRQAMNVEWDEAQEQRKKAWKIFVSLREGNNAAAFFKKYSQYSRPKLKEEFPGILEILASFIRDLILLKTGGDKELMMNPDLEKKLQSQPAVPDAGVFLELMNQIDECLFSLQKNLNPKVVMESLTAHFMENHHV